MTTTSMRRIMTSNKLRKGGQKEKHAKVDGD